MQRKFDAETNRSYPEVDVQATYEIKNALFGPIAITVTNPSRTSMQTVTLGGRKSIMIEGNRMTDMVFDLQRKGHVRITVLDNPES